MGVLNFVCYVLMVFNIFGRLFRFLKVCWVVIFFWFIDGNLMYLCFILYKVLRVFLIVLIMIVLLKLKFEVIVI